jgi:hypothetical protein
MPNWRRLSYEIDSNGGISAACIFSLLLAIEAQLLSCLPATSSGESYKSGNSLPAPANY